jgi:hypothetical protein
MVDECVGGSILIDLAKRLRGLKRLGMGPLNVIVDIEVLLSLAVSVFLSVEPTSRLELVCG